MASSGEFNPVPSLVANPVLWLDASSPNYMTTDFAGTTFVSADGDAVGRWKDRSGNYADCMQNTSLNKPVYKTNILNGKSVLRFNGSSQYLNNIMSEFMTYKNSYTIFVVMKPSDTSANYTALGFHSQVADVQQTITAINVTSSRGSLYGSGTRPSGLSFSNPYACSNGLVNKFSDDTYSSFAPSSATGSSSVFVFAKKTDNTLWSFGNNTYGNLGKGYSYSNTQIFSVPEQVGSDTWGNYFCGNTHFVGVKSDGTMWGCGGNGNGQLGQGNNTSYFSLVQFGALNTWSKVYGTSNTFAIKTDGTLWACGSNFSGVLGLGDTSSRTSLTQVGVATDWDSISVSANFFAFGIKTGGTLWSWGSNNYGQLGHGDITQRLSPVQVGVGTNWSKISVGPGFALAIKTDGTLWASGRNAYGQLGLGANIANQSTFIQVGTDTDWSDVAISSLIGVFSNPQGVNSFCLKTNGTMWASGFNGGYYAGIDDQKSKYVFTQIGTDTDWSALYGRGLLYAKKTNNKIYQIGPAIIGPSTCSYQQIGNSNEWKAAMVCGNLSYLGLKQNGTLWAWGSNYGGCLGFGTMQDEKVNLTQIGTDSNWSMIGSNVGAPVVSYAVKNDGTLWTWGYAGYSQLLGQGNTQFVSTFQQMTEIGSVWSDMWGNRNTTFLKKNDGTVWVTGCNYWGAMGNGKGNFYASLSNSYTNNTIESTSFTSVSDMQLGQSTFTMLKSDGTIWNWGFNGYYGALGQNIASTSNSYYIYPVQVGTDTNWSAIATSFHTLAIKSTGTLWGWGLNNFGQLGQGNTNSTYYSPTQIGVDTTWSKVATGGQASFAIKTDGTLWTWGRNNYGQLGQGDTSTRTSPTQVGALTTWSKIYANTGIGCTYAIKTDGTLWATGNNSGGFIGFGYVSPTSTSVTSFTQVGTDTDWSEVYVPQPSASYVFAKKTNGTLWCAGIANRINLFAYFNPFLLQQVNSDNWTILASSINETVGIKSNGTLWAWGSNSQGQLGQNDTLSRFSKTQVGTDVDWAYAITSNASMYAIKTNGTLWACGLNTFGQLGLGNTSTGPRVLTQVGVATNWSVIVGTSGSVAALRTDGTLWTWGTNSYGQLGLGDTTQRTSPTQVGTDTNWTKVVANGGGGFTALKSNGTLWSWGGNGGGGLWLGDTITRRVPTQVPGYTDWVELTHGTNSIAAIRSDGTLWVSSVSGLGINAGYYASSSNYVKVNNDTDWSKVYLNNGSGFYAFKNDGSLWSFGSSSSGSFGVGTQDTIAQCPIKINNGTYTCAGASIGGPAYLKRTSDNTTWCCVGSSITSTFADCVNINPTIFTQVGTDTNWSKVVLGSNRIMALKTDGTVYLCGQTPTGTTSLKAYTAPMQVGSDTDWKSIPINNARSSTSTLCATKTNGDLYINASSGTGIGLGNSNATGSFINHPYINNCDSIQSANSSFSSIKTKSNVLYKSGTLNNCLIGFETNGFTFQQVPGEWAKISNSINLHYYIKSDGTLWGIGNAIYDWALYAPFQNTSFSNPLDASVSNNNSFIIKQDGTLWASGLNSYGSLGLGVRGVAYGFGLFYTYQRVPSSGSWTKITASGNHTIGLKSDGTMWGCGLNSNGQLGLGYTASTPINSFYQLNSTTNWTDICISSNFCHALKSDGTLWGWGQNNYGQLGVGNSSTGPNIPTQIGVATNWSKMYNGRGFFVAIKTDGTLWATGQNNVGQLGQGDTTQRTSLTQIGTDTNWVSAACGPQHVLAIKSNGTLWAWGGNAYGCLGQGNYSTSPNVPTQVGTDTDWSFASAGYSVSFAVKTNGTLWSCGRGTGGASARNTLKPSNTFTQVGSSTWSAFYNEQSSFTGMATLDNVGKDLYVWGAYNIGQTGVVDPFSMYQMNSDTNWLLPYPSNSSGSDFLNAAIKQDGTLWAWGRNYAGKFGTGNTIDVIPSITQVGSDSNYTDVSYTTSSSLVIKYSADNNTAGSATSSPSYISVVYDGTQGTNASKLKTYINGNIQTTTYGSTVPASMLRSAGYDVGRTFGKSNYFNGDIAEIIIYDTNLSDDIRQQIENYLKAKWKI